MLNAALMTGNVPRVKDAPFEEIVRERGAQVVRTAYRILGNWADAEDVAQEALIRLYRHGLNFPNGAALGTWLYRVTINLCVDRVRSARRVEGLPELRSLDPSAEAIAIRAQEKHTLMAALAVLPTRERAAVVLREIEGLSTAEVAEILGSSEGTVRSQVSKAIVRLREFLAREGV